MDKRDFMKIEFNVGFEGIYYIATTPWGLYQYKDCLS